jgi:hypothetical protein
MATPSDGNRPCVGKADRTTKIVCTKEARVPYLGKGGYPRGGVWLGRDLKGVGGVDPARASHRLLRGSFAENWDRPKRETLVKPLERQERRKSLKGPTKCLIILVDAVGLEPTTR